jgi:NitT/TauT family transport system substrate-binding protein
MMLAHCALKARLVIASLLTMLALAAASDAQADDALKAKVGVLRLSSSAPVFIAQDKGYFREAGLDVELKFFDAAQPIAVATTSGDVDFGITAFTGQGHVEGDRRHEPRKAGLSPDRLFRQQ